MPKKKIILFLTDVALHTGKHRSAQTLENAIKGEVSPGVTYGRLYTDIGPDGKLLIKIPQDMQDAINRGEIEVDLAFPKKGLPVFAGNDTVEKLSQMNRKQRRQIIHNNRGRIWRKE